MNQYYKNRQSNNNNNNDREIFKGSSSSNFFNNRNNGKENDDDYDDNVNVNQNRDQVQRRKIIRNKQKRPVPQQQQQQQQNSENVTQKPARPTGFRNNFAGSSFVPTTSRPTSTTINSDQYTTAINNYRIRQRVSQNRQYNNDVPTSAPSTPAPFRQTQQYNNPPVRQQQQTTQPPKQPQQTENYPSSFAQQQYDVQKVKVSKPAVEKNEKPTTPFAKTENYPSNNPQYYNKKATTPAKQFNNDYPTTFSPKNKPTGFKPAVDTFPTTFAPKTNSGYTQIQQQTIQYNKQNNNNQFKQTTPFNAQNNQQQYNNNQNTQQYNNNQNTQQYNNNQNTQQYNNNQNTQQYNNNKQTTAYNQQQYSNNQNTQQYNNNNKQTTPYNAQNNQQQYNNNKQTTPFYNQNTQQQYNNQQYNNQQFNSQKSTPQYNPSTNFNNNKQSSTPRTTPFTQYTPTVPKVTSTTPVSRSNRFDETQYDDGSYNQKYDYDGNERKEDEFLKTAHSQNIANSRNEYIKSTKVNTQQPVVTQKPYFEAPRPFSVSPNTPQKVTNNYPVTSKKPQVVQNNNKNNKPVEQPKQQPVQPQKTKDVSYDYAYYDSNTGVEPDYEIDTEIKKSTVKN